MTTQQENALEALKEICKSHVDYKTIIQPLLETIRAALQTDWQPIDSAPRDNRAVWATDGKGGLLPITWMPKWYGDKDSGYWAFTYGTCKVSVEKEMGFVPVSYTPLPSAPPKEGAL